MEIVDCRGEAHAESESQRLAAYNTCRHSISVARPDFLIFYKYALENDFKNRSGEGRVYLLK
jgi:hypothetical protein